MYNRFTDHRLESIEEVMALFEQREEELNLLITQLQKELVDPLPGILHIGSSGRRVQFHQLVRDSGKKSSETYLSRTGSLAKIRKLAQQDYDRQLLRAAVQQREELRKIADRLGRNIEDLDTVYTKLHPERKLLVEPAVPDPERYVKEWCEVTYAPGKFSPRDQVFMTERGERVRSKSEILCADRYLHRSVPYRFEYPIELTDGGEIVIYRPDFTLLNRRTLKEYRHEHLGKMDDIAYVRRNLHRLDVYHENGFILGEDLLITYETGDAPLDLGRIDDLIDRYLT